MVLNWLLGAGRPWPWADIEAPELARWRGRVRNINDAVSFKFGCDLETLQNIGGLLCCGLPRALPLTAQWHGVVDRAGAVLRKLELSVDHRECKMWQTFQRDEDGQLVVTVGLLELSARFQRDGVAGNVLRSSLLAYDRLEVARVVCTANFDIGGYAWAKLGAAAMYPNEVRVLLRDRLRRIPFLSENLEYRWRLRWALRWSSDDRLMWNVARMKSKSGELIGKELLLGSSWEAYWDLRSPAHRRRIAKALN